MATTASNADLESGAGSLLPIAHWLPRYELSWLRFDLMAGLTLAAYAIPPEKSGHRG